MLKTEAELIILTKDGDMKAFDALVALHQERVYFLAYKIMGNPDDARDIQQETFVRAWQSIRKFRNDSAFATWLHRITVNLCISHKRRREPVYESESLGEWVVDNGEHVVACLEKKETMTIVRKVLNALPPHYRILIVLREMEDRSFEQIAVVLGCSVQSARTRLCKAKKLLREKLIPYLADEH